jgi:hypothetical protein
MTPEEKKAEARRRNWEFRFRIIEVVGFGVFGLLLGGITAYIASRTDEALHSLSDIANNSYVLQQQIGAYQKQIMQDTMRQATTSEQQKEVQERLNNMLRIKTEASTAAVLLERLACSSEEKSNLIFSLLSTTDQKAVDIITNNCKSLTLPSAVAIQPEGDFLNKIRLGFEFYNGVGSFTKQEERAGEIWCAAIKNPPPGEYEEKLESSVTIREAQQACESKNYLKAADLFAREFGKILSFPNNH